METWHHLLARVEWGSKVPRVQTSKPSSGPPYWPTPVSQIYHLSGDQLSSKVQGSTSNSRRDKAAPCQSGKRCASQPQRCHLILTSSFPGLQGKLASEIWVQGCVKYLDYKPQRPEARRLHPGCASRPQCETTHLFSQRIAQLAALWDCAVMFPTTMNCDIQQNVPSDTSSCVIDVLCA